jgi:hypothetical protein
VTVVVAAAVPEGVTEDGLKEQVMPEEQPKETAALKPLIGVTVRVALTGAALVAVPLAGLIESEKSGTGAAVMVILTADDTEAAKLPAPA